MTTYEKDEKIIVYKDKYGDYFISYGRKANTIPTEDFGDVIFRLWSCSKDAPEYFVPKVITQRLSTAENAQIAAIRQRALQDLLA